MNNKYQKDNMGYVMSQKQKPFNKQNLFPVVSISNRIKINAINDKTLTILLTSVKN